MKHVLLLAFLGSWLGCSSSGGTETDNPASPLSGFASSGCKSKTLAPGQQALVVASDAEGLQCVEWETNASGTLQLRLLNFPEPCGETYQGRATLGSDGMLELSVYKDVCAVAKCGICVFDFDFELSVALDTALDLRIGTAACESAPVMFNDELSLPLDQQSSGVLCRPLERGALEWHARSRGSCGERNMPCGDCESADMTTCAPDLLCTELSPTDARCLSACESSDDCPGGLTTCRDGVCQASTSF